jgi:uncharacterized protein YqjF (DUF2071 family)
MSEAVVPAAVSRLLAATGRDVLFAHWPVDPGTLAPSVPEPLDVDSFDGSARVSVLALENRAVAPGSVDPPRGRDRRSASPARANGSISERT